jgi:cytochrome c oxidase subunit 3
MHPTPKLVHNSHASLDSAMQQGLPQNPVQKTTHSFHILGPSPFPHLVGFYLFVFLTALTMHMHGLETPLLPTTFVLHLSFLGLFWIVMNWFMAILVESSQGHHTRKVRQGLRLGMLLFILSEVMLFFAFFWAFFHFSLIPSVAVGAIWPPEGTQVLDAWGLPFANTLLLLTSGITITIAHAYIVRGNHDGFAWYLLLTILLGVTFLFCQAYEYKYGVKFSWRDNIYGSIFFLTTGFHGMHVTIGTLFLAFCWLREYLTYGIFNEVGTKSSYNGAFAFTPKRHFGFEAAAWYWHFVDVVWLFLFLSIYWWGGKN